MSFTKSLRQINELKKGWTLSWLVGRLNAGFSLTENLGSRLSDGEIKNGLCVEGVFDLASLTKVLAGSTLIVDSFRNSSPKDFLDFINSPIADHVEELKDHWLAKKRIIELWEHRCGLASHANVMGRPAEVDRSLFWSNFMELILKQSEQPNRDNVYSDLGYILLTLIMEKYWGQDTLCRWQNFSSTNEIDLGFEVNPNRELYPTDSRHPQREVNDDNCFALGSQSLHAGLFGGVKEIWRLLQVIHEWDDPVSRLWKSPRPVSADPYRRFYLGWDRPQYPESSTAGDNFSTLCLGHLGYTGCSFWWDLKTHQVGILLANRIFPNDDEASKEIMFGLRRSFYADLWGRTLLQ